MAKLLHQNEKSEIRKSNDFKPPCDGISNLVFFVFFIVRKNQWPFNM